MDTESTIGDSQLLDGKIVASSRDKNSILILSGEKFQNIILIQIKKNLLHFLIPSFLKYFKNSL